ncbi:MULTISPECIES: hypothetical protein [Kitasatospora]|uniref:Uncharacterized protein n=1 Tax=Kitasatospora indigofera TaxID=67307 RepID=A0A919FML6_9ACTN|nr:hypothetical protein [Kitasatospora herbaricolor]MDQ0309500.1 hypothetical protein [Kitasatospora herbaricolor]GGV01444.1 hypothetical protein GCM10010495_10650 [Kitasatospora herbaricolor]GHH68684.1 hypothetical protein GCM10018781_26100 [Kitasatospora indigofera]
MVQAILEMTDRALSRVLRKETAEAYCACPAGSSTYCVGDTLVTKFCCSWNCAVAPSCTYTYVYGAC